MKHNYCILTKIKLLTAVAFHHLQGEFLKRIIRTHGIKKFVLILSGGQHMVKLCLILGQVDSPESPKTPEITKNSQKLPKKKTKKKLHNQIKKKKLIN